ncbi:MAG: PilN domain-containing protein [Dissulfuribacterales bacterium]
MIRINLLPVREWRKKEALRQLISVFFLSFLLILVACLAVGITLQTRVSAAREAHAKLEERKKQLDYVEKTIKDLDAKSKEIDNKFATIEDLQRGRTLTLEILDYISSVFPGERMWISKLDLKGNRLTMTGFALDNHTVAFFMSRLEPFKLFKAVTLTSIAKKPYEGQEIKNKGQKQNADVQELMNFEIAVDIEVPRELKPASGAAKQTKQGKKI